MKSTGSPLDAIVEGVTSGGTIRSGTDREAQRANGAFYTPMDLAAALASWAVTGASDRVLDPSAGEGALLGAAAGRLRELGGFASKQTLLGVDVDGAALRRARTSLQDQGWSVKLHNADFLQLQPDDVGGRFSAVVTNPPYVRHHLLGTRAKQRGRSAAATAGVDLADTASYWAYFLVHALEFVAPGGRLAAIVPGSLVHAAYATRVRAALRAAFDEIYVLLLEPRVFSSVLENTVVVLATGRGGKKGAVRVGTATGINGTLAETSLARRTQAVRAREDDASWIRATLGESSLSLYDEARLRFERLGELARVHIGVVTGANAFFLLRPSQAASLALGTRATQPIITRAAHLPGLVLGGTDYQELLDDDRRALLFSPPAPSRWTNGVARYLREGQAAKIHRRFKCSRRDPWHAVPLVPIPDAFLSYMSWTFPRLVVNAARVPCTNTIHAVYWKRRVSRREASSIALAMTTSLAQLSAELEGRSYGGGVLKVEPSEASRLLVPRGHGNDNDFAKVDELLRAGRRAEATRIADRICLGPHYSSSEVETFAATVRVLRRRRWARKKNAGEQVG